MGVEEDPKRNLDLLVRESQFDQIVADILATGQYERIQQSPRYRVVGGLTAQVPCLQHIDERHPLHGIRLSLWSEDVYKLSADGPMVEVPSLMFQFPMLIEDRFHPTTGTTSKTETFPRDFESSCPVYIPTIPCLLNALLDQQRYRLANREKYKGISTIVPSCQLRRITDRLHLVEPQQREILFAELADENRAGMEVELGKHAEWLERRRAASACCRYLPG
ncbi:MAG: hypothetical protein M1840_003074 [Geoglossum simile]|nr:MAG: hypothetical protein M1840_003074 [Geoglossum simile]